jgi:putative ABC transport system substrate-binding protein
MRRRDFIAGLGGAAAWPLAARAQQRAEGVRRIGALIDGSGFQRANEPLRDALRSLGWIEGRNLQLDFRYGVDEAQLRSAAEELIRLQPDALFAVSDRAATAISNATRTIPVVFYLGREARAVPFAGNIPRPTTKMTGWVGNVTTLGGKWLQLLKDAVPRLSRVAIVSIGPEGITDFLPTVQTAAAAVGVTAIPLVVPRDPVQIESAFAAFAGQGDAGLVFVPPVPGGFTVFSDAVRRHNLPAIASVRSFPDAGGLMSYGVRSGEGMRVAASYLDSILRGAKPGDLPVHFASRFELVINLKTAQAIGLQIPAILIALADEVIE